MKKPFNSVRLAGYLYDHKLVEKVSGPTSKNPGTTFYTGTIDVATDDECLNIVTVHYSYVTATNAKGENPLFKTLANIYNGVYKTVVGSGIEDAYKLRVDTALALNDFYVDRNGEEELVSAKRNEGGFIHGLSTLPTSIDERNLFDVDMIITGVTRTEADPERETEEFVTVKGAIFDFRKALLPYDFKVTNKKAMDYFEDLEVSPKSPVFTHLKGRQLSSVVKKTFVEEGAFGEDSVREVVNSRKDYVLHWAAKETYPFDDEETITKEELKKAREDRNTYLADVKKRNDDYKANKGNAIGSTTTVAPVDAKAADDDDWDF